MIIRRFFSVILPLIFCCWSSVCSAYEHSTYSNNNDAQVESTYDEKERPNVDEYIDAWKYEKASYKHEQSLLANIYSPTRTYISMHDDRIHPSNFSYFTFNSPGIYRFILISLQGDADMYISTRHKHVNYDNYEFSSCTCGIDEILIDAYMKRPIYIGIYGYSPYQISHYRLLIELVDSKTLPDEMPFPSSASSDVDDQTSADNNERQTSQKNRKPPPVIVEDEKDGRHLLWNILVWILQFLVEVLT